MQNESHLATYMMPWRRPMADARVLLEGTTRLAALQGAREYENFCVDGICILGVAGGRELGALGEQGAAARAMGVLRRDALLVAFGSTAAFHASFLRTTTATRWRGEAAAAYRAWGATRKAETLEASADAT